MALKDRENFTVVQIDATTARPVAKAPTTG
jgi:hypothetical protein